MVTNGEEPANGERWADALVKRAGEAAKTLRGKRSAKWLSDRTAELGYRLSPQVIARLDSGRRAGHLEVAELMVLARALGVAPVLLLFPFLLDGPVEVLPGVEAPSGMALRWFTGEDRDSWNLPWLFEDDRTGVAVSPLELVRQYYRTIEEIHQYEDDILNAGGEDAANKWRTVRARKVKTLGEVKAYIRAAGLTLEGTDR